MKNDEFYTRTEDIDGVKEWLWIKDETGLWLGPMQNWVNSHKEKIQKYCKRHNTVIQAGGGAGMYPRLLSNMFEVVYTFEPEPANFQCLVRNCRNRNVWFFNAALGPKNGFIGLKEGSRSNRGTHRVEEREGGIQVPQLAIDTIPFKGCDLLWLDVEGYESKVLEGAKQTIGKFKPLIMAEGGKNRCGDIMKQLGYEQIDQSVSDTVYKHRDS